MNKERRKQIATVLAKIEAMAWELSEGDVHSYLYEVKEDERSYFDNMPESIQSSHKGEDAEACADTLQEAHDMLEEAWSILNQVCEKLEAAAA